MNGVSNPFRSPWRQLFLIMAPVTALAVSAVIMGLPVVQEAIAEYHAPPAVESVR